MSATIRALARLLDASYLDGPPTDGQRDLWREAAAKARDGGTCKPRLQVVDFSPAIPRTSVPARKKIARDACAL